MSDTYNSNQLINKSMGSNHFLTSSCLEVIVPIRASAVAKIAKAVAICIDVTFMIIFYLILIFVGVD